MKNNIKVGIVNGKFHHQICSAYIIPQNHSHCSALAVFLAQNYSLEEAVNEYQAVLDMEPSKKVKPGTILCSRGDDLRAEYLLHVVTEGELPEKNFSTVQRCVYLALHYAEKYGLKTIACPELGAQNLQPHDMAMAILSAIDAFPNKKGVIEQFNIVLTDKPWANIVMEKILNNEIYRGAQSPHEPDFNFAEWIEKTFH